MNKGIISKVKIDDKYHYCIRLENTVEIKHKNGNELEYNVFLFETNDSTPDAKLVPIEEYFTCDFDLSVFLGKKLTIRIDWENKNLTSIEYYES